MNQEIPSLTASYCSLSTNCYVRPLGYKDEKGSPYCHGIESVRGVNRRLEYMVVNAI